VKTVSLIPKAGAKSTLVLPANTRRQRHTDSLREALPRWADPDHQGILVPPAPVPLLWPALQTLSDHYGTHYSDVVDRHMDKAAATDLRHLSSHSVSSWTFYMLKVEIASSMMHSLMYNWVTSAQSENVVPLQCSLCQHGRIKSRTGGSRLMRCSTALKRSEASNGAQFAPVSGAHVDQPLCVMRAP
jgi:hypothetical protein